MNIMTQKITRNFIQLCQTLQVFQVNKGVVSCFLFSIMLSLVFINSASAKPIDIQQAVNIAKNKYPGKVLKSKKHSSNGNSEYKIKIVQKNGKVLNVTVDGETKKVNKR